MRSPRRGELDAAADQVANAWLLPRSAVRHAFAAPGWLSWLPVGAFVLVVGTLVAINVLIASDPARVAAQQEAEEAKRRGKYPPQESSSTGINGYPLPYISEAASQDVEFVIWRIGLGATCVVMIFLYSVLLPIYPATMAAVDPLPATAMKFAWTRAGWRLACILTAFAYTLLLVVANTRVRHDAQEARVHTFCFGLALCTLAVAEPLLTASRTELHFTNAIRQEGSWLSWPWLTWYRLAMWLTLICCGVLVVGAYVFHQVVHHGVDYSTVEYVAVGAVIAFQFSVDAELRALMSWLREQQAERVDDDAFRPSPAEERARARVGARRSESERKPLFGAASRTESGMKKCPSWP